MKYLHTLFNKTPFHIFLIITVTFITFSPVLKMFFYSDDFGDIYLLTHGPIIHGYPPTSIDVSQYILEILYPYFGLNSTGYYAVGLGVVTLTVVILYLFARGIFKNNKLALVAGLIYATTPIGTSSVFQLLTFYTESGYLINLVLLVALCLLISSFERGKRYYYILVAILLYVFLSIHQRRGFFLIPVLFLLDYFVNVKKIFPSVGTIIRQIPLIIIFLYTYAATGGLANIFSGQVSTANIDTGAKFSALINAVFADIKPLVSMANILAGLPLMFLGDNIYDFDVFKYRDFWTAVTLIITFAIVIISYRVKRRWGNLSLFFLGWMYTSIIGFYVFSSPGISETISRTVTLAAPAYGLFVALSGYVFYTILKNKKIFSVRNLNILTFLIIILVLAVHFYATNTYLEGFNQRRSRYAKTFFSDMIKIRPTVPANSLIYIATPKDPQIKSRLYNIYKGNSFGAGGTLGIYYHLTYKELEMVNAIEDVEKYVGQDISRIDSVYSFYYDDNGLSDITDSVRADFTKNHKKKI